ncbi:MAG: cell division protein SepF [Anaerococcus prevotii]|uniref:cell division protein SepF n=1 Tax=Anaerococcus prevotii TaxID=33034 RepID=UPI00290434B6|nr:cell division protein SepF [Anaerococcus prevotii]MDU2558843.1 cell division protein SepF [Anaerococcus prevotii]MDU2583862.1 cell division protein SepF [Anaerococcus prevotii]MDU3136319.1 cell division protein SepF [Anaerococcus prevotii]
MLDRFKEFIGIDDKYDDYDEDQLYYDDLEEETKEEEKDKAEKNETYKSYFSDSDYKSEESDESYKSSFADSFKNNSSFKSSRSSRRGDNVVKMSDKNFAGSNSMRISIQEPLDYETDAPKVIDDILNKKVVVLNLEMVESDTRRQIFDFVSGAVYALSGTVEKVTKGIFVISPNGIQIDPAVTDQISEGNYNQL